MSDSSSLRRPPGAFPRALLLGGLAGGAAGLCALGVDQLLAWLTAGYTVPIGLLHGVLYAASGTAIGATTTALASLFRRSVRAAWISASVLTMLYAASVAERILTTLASRLPSAAATLLAIAALAGLAAWVAILHRILGGGSSDAAGALTLAAATVAVGLAINRNSISEPFSTEALSADAAILAASAALAGLGRLAGLRRLAAVAALLTVGVVVTVALARQEGAPGASDDLTSSATGRPSDGATDLLLIVIDTLRADVFEAVVAETPEGRAFAEALDPAAWFRRAFAASPWTAPSMGSILTGLYPDEHGFGATQNDPSRPLRRLAASAPTLAEGLRRLGYRTEAIGTNPILLPESGIGRGFERYEILGGPTLKLPLLTVLAGLGLLDRDYYQQAIGVRKHLARGLDELAGDRRPFFLYLHLMDPHAPLHRHRGLPAEGTAARLAEEEQLYRDEVRYALAELARILEDLAARGLLADTLVVVVADHGEMFASDGHEGGWPGERARHEGHGFALYDELVRVPLVIRPPGGLATPRRVDALASHVDLYDTVVDLLGVDLAPIGGDRVSLAPWVAGEAASQGRSHALLGGIQAAPEHRGLVDPRWKLIHYPGGERPDELFDRRADPAELRDLSADERPFRRLMGRLARAWEAQRPPPEDTSPVELDAETRRRLRGLGYIQ